MDEVESEYRVVLADRPPWAQESSALRFHLEQSVAPALAVYRVLQRHGVPPEPARAEVGRLVEAQMAPVLGVVGALDRLRLPFAALRALNRRLVPRMFPAAGFTIDWVRDDPDSLAFDFSACFYLRVLRHYGAGELTGVFCHGDELAYARMPRTLRFTRTGTMAGGAPRCDFVLHPVRRAS
ncbi:L-2-amino-thiazoline-4-carboxylic acid hydrolase [Phycicoccus flavus]|uniref:L-2-amino-thiazoline-4-carboxylic acid hydrolase n=1 Tax=Phycicoccus flavus TaxID=2502783 RepID=A0A8T6R3N0_9MICO|nr:L-2-amino-thiazoline-4-carboxylic acid hydrolase [Phycicoccus flavus]NHA68577.1 L-2-amino-thiazoline-4-carboxylic acid hydrolase [Phycicoccus flavus]